MGNLRDEIYEYINTTPLKSCPFCGGVAVKLKHGMAGKKRVEGVRQSFVQCKSVAAEPLCLHKAPSSHG